MLAEKMNVGTSIQCAALVIHPVRKPGYFVVFVLAAALFYGCAVTPPPAGEFGKPVSLPELAVDEVAIVLNLNTTLGNHAGMFVGATLSDPAGSYRGVRSGEPGWKGPDLADYVRFQMNDGDKIQIYRFKLVKADFSTIESRVLNFGVGAPLFCAADVQNQIAGVGPFSTIKPIWWTSPADLGEKLRALVGDAVTQGVCTWPSGRSC